MEATPTTTRLVSSYHYWERNYIYSTVSKQKEQCVKLQKDFFEQNPKKQAKYDITMYSLEGAKSSTNSMHENELYILFE